MKDSSQAKAILRALLLTVFAVYLVHLRPLSAQYPRYIASAQGVASHFSFAHPSVYHVGRDVMEHNNGRYSTIPPGIPILMAPFCKIYQWIKGIEKRPNRVQHYFLVLIIQLFIQVLPAMLATGMLFRFVCDQTGDSERALLIGLLFAFGSMVFLYSTDGIWSHGLTTSLMTIGILLRLKGKRGWTYGSLYALAILCDWGALPLVLVLGIADTFLALQKRTQTELFRYVTAATPVLLALWALLEYNFFFSGSYWQGPSGVNYNRLVANGSLQPKTYPSNLEEIWILTFGVRSGIFLYFPAFFIFVWQLAKRKFKHEILYYVFAAIPFLYMAVVISKPDVSASVCFGPRRLVVLTPFVLLCLYSARKKHLFWALVAGSCIELIGISTHYSQNLFLNFGLFLLRGPYPDIVVQAKELLLPRFFRIKVEIITPFFLYVGLGLFLWKAWAGVPIKWRKLATQD